MHYTLTLPAFLFTAAIQALTITSPGAGSTLDPTQAITVKWTTSSGDPSTINLSLSAPSDSSFSSTTFATNVQAADGSYTIPAGTLAGYGSGFSIAAESGSGGSEIANTGELLLSYGVNQVVTESNGQVSLAPTPSAPANGNSASVSSIIFDTSGVAGQSVTASYLPSTDLSATISSGGTVVTSTLSASSTDASATSASSSRTSGTSGLSSTTSRSTSSSTTSATAAASNAAQARFTGTDMGLMGLLVGLAAVIA